MAIKKTWDKKWQTFANVKDGKYLIPITWLNGKFKSKSKAKKWIETQLEDAKSNKGKSKRNRLINKILNPEIEITEKDVNYDLKQTVHRNREMSKEIDEEYDEADVGHRQTEEMMEGAEEIYDDLPDEPEFEEESEEQRRLDEDEDW